MKTKTQTTIDNLPTVAQLEQKVLGGGEVSPEEMRLARERDNEAARIEELKQQRTESARRERETRAAENLRAEREKESAKAYEKLTSAFRNLADSHPLDDFKSKLTALLSELITGTETYNGNLQSLRAATQKANGDFDDLPRVVSVNGDKIIFDDRSLQPVGRLSSVTADVLSDIVKDLKISGRIK